MWEGVSATYAFGPKAHLFPSNTLAGGAVWGRSDRGLGVDLSSTSTGTAIELGTADPIPEGNFTLVFAGRLDVLPGASDFGQMVCKRDTFAAADMRWQFFIRQTASPTNVLTLNSETESIESDFIPSLGYHVWMVTDDGTNTRFYEDSVLVDTVVNSLTFSSDAAAGLRIGNSQTDGTENFDGVADTVYMFERALSDAEAALIARDPHGLFRPVSDLAALVALQPAGFGITHVVGI